LFITISAGRHKAAGFCRRVYNNSPGATPQVSFPAPECVNNYIAAKPLTPIVLREDLFKKAIKNLADKIFYVGSQKG
jgi:hypothetical protein